MLQEAKCFRATTRACGSTVGGMPARTEFAGGNVNPSLVVRAFVEQAKGLFRIEGVVVAGLCESLLLLPCGAGVRGGRTLREDRSV